LGGEQVRRKGAEVVDRVRLCLGRVVLMHTRQRPCSFPSFALKVLQLPSFCVLTGVQGSRPAAFLCSGSHCFISHMAVIVRQSTPNFVVISSSSRLVVLCPSAPQLPACLPSCHHPPTPSRHRSLIPAVALMDTACSSCWVQQQEVLAAARLAALQHTCAVSFPFPQQY
jgi:hypothetical protein